MKHIEDLADAEQRCIVCGAEPGNEDPDCPQCGSDHEPPEPDYNALLAALEDCEQVLSWASNDRDAPAWIKHEGTQDLIVKARNAIAKAKEKLR